MNPEPKEINETSKRNGEAVKLRLRYPHIEENTKAAKRINACLDGVFGAIKENAKKSRRFSFFVCSFVEATAPSNISHNPANIRQMIAALKLLFIENSTPVNAESVPVYVSITV